MGFCIFTRGVYIYMYTQIWWYIYRWIVPKIKRHPFWVPSMEPPIYLYIQFH